MHLNGIEGLLGFPTTHTPLFLQGFGEHNTCVFKL